MAGRSADRQKAEEQLLSKAAGSFSINKKTGDITVSSGLKKGTYTLKIKVAAAGNKTYAPGKKTVNVTVVVK